VPFFRFRRTPFGYVTTTDTGDWRVVPLRTFETACRGFLAGDAGALRALRLPSPSVHEAALRAAKRRSFVFQGPSLHILVVTLRCNQACAYCHASRVGPRAPGVDMSPGTARQAVNRALESTSRPLTFEFQGGEPLLNWPVVREVVEYATRENGPHGHELHFSLVTNLTALTGERLAWLADRRVHLCTSLDGPADLHDRNRPWAGGSSHAATVAWMARIDAAYAERRLGPWWGQAHALATVTRAALGRPEDVVDEYVRLGRKVVHLRPLNPFGLADRVWDRIGYGADEFLAFWRRALERVLEHNRRGVEILEKGAALHLAKILGDDDPNYMELRSPCGAAIGQVAYDHDGSVYTCDEGRMLARMGDPLFRLGDVRGDELEAMLTSTTARSVAAASLLESNPSCSVCAYLPYCGICPVYNHRIQGDLCGRMPESGWCRVRTGMLDELFRRLHEGGAGTRAIFRRWVRRPGHPPADSAQRKKPQTNTDEHR
jgi:His-Xaa-Ser system radical SAM maturase HxsB